MGGAGSLRGPCRGGARRGGAGRAWGCAPAAAWCWGCCGTPTSRCPSRRTSPGASAPRPGERRFAGLRAGRRLPWGPARPGPEPLARSPRRATPRCCLDLSDLSAGEEMTVFRFAPSPGGPEPGRRRRPPAPAPPPGARGGAADREDARWAAAGAGAAGRSQLPGPALVPAAFASLWLVPGAAARCGCRLLVSLQLQAGRTRRDAGRGRKCPGCSLLRGRRSLRGSLRRAASGACPSRGSSSAASGGGRVLCPGQECWVGPGGRPVPSREPSLPLAGQRLGLCWLGPCRAQPVSRRWESGRWRHCAAV